MKTLYNNPNSYIVLKQNFQRFEKRDIATASLFLAAKVEETPIKIQHVICVRDKILSKGQKTKQDPNSDEYKKSVDRLVEHEVGTN